VGGGQCWTAVANVVSDGQAGCDAGGRVAGQQQLSLWEAGLRRQQWRAMSEVLHDLVEAIIDLCRYPTS